MVFHVDNKPITIPDGNYNAERMVKALKNIVTIDVNSDTGIGTNKTIINTSSTVNFNLTFDGNSIDNTP